MTDIKPITLIDAKAQRVKLDGVVLIGITDVETFEQACTEFAKRYPKLHPTTCYQYGIVYYFPCEVKHD